MTKEGWAVVDGNGINIRTVMDTRVAAIINWLVVVKSVLITNGDTNETIEKMWTEQCGTAQVRKIVISVAGAD